MYGIDLSPEMIARAGKKARKAGLDIDFRNASIEALPFSDGQFNVVMSTLMLRKFGWYYSTVRQMRGCHSRLV